MKPFVLLLLLVTLAVAAEDKPITMRKCCAKGKHLDVDTNSCLTSESDVFSDNASETLTPPINTSTHDWIHPHFRFSTIEVLYNSLPDVELDLSVTLMCKDSALYKVRNFEGSIHPSMILEERFCIDSTPRSNGSRVLFRSIRLKAIYKCCLKGQRLRAETNTCEAFDVFKPSDEQEEVVGPHTLNSPLFRWLPANTSQFVLKIRYNALNSGYNFNTVVKEDDKFQWEVIASEEVDEAVVSFQGQDSSGGKVNGTTDIFCFDEFEDGSRVLLAAIYHVPKCCGKGEELNGETTTCSPRQGQTVHGINNDLLDWKSSDAFWLPNSLRRDHIPVRYHMMSRVGQYSTSEIRSDDDIWSLYYDTGSSLPRLILNLRDLSGRPHAIETTNFCFDYLRGSHKIVIMRVPKYNDLHEKCCFLGEVLSPQVLCNSEQITYWSQSHRSSVNGLTNQTTTKLRSLKRYCEKWSVEKLSHSPSYQRLKRGYFPASRLKEDSSSTELLTSVPSSRDLVSSYRDSSTRSLLSANFSHGLLELSSPDTLDDFGHTAAGECTQWKEEERLLEFVGAHTVASYVRVYEAVRPLGALAAAMLAAAAALAVTTARSSAHGCALAAHALCLAAANALQVAWFYNWPSLSGGCQPYMYVTYFFMVAANFWLTAITFNMSINFRRPLGALASEGARGGRYALLRFAYMSSFAWGGAAFLTTFAAAAFTWRTRLRLRGFVTPSFFETRTCVYEHELFTDDRTWLGDPLGSLCYYFAPMAVLAVSNCICVLVTMRHLRLLRKGTSILRKDLRGVNCLPPKHLQKALVYVRLLLTSGVVELLLEAATWAWGRRARRFYSLDRTLVLNFEYAFLFATVATLVNLVRAVAVLWLVSGRWWDVRAAARAMARVMRRWAEASHGRGRWDVQEESSTAGHGTLGVWKSVGDEVSSTASMGLA